MHTQILIILVFSMAQYGCKPREDASSAAGFFGGSSLPDPRSLQSFPRAEDLRRIDVSTMAKPLVSKTYTLSQIMRYRGKNYQTYQLDNFSRDPGFGRDFVAAFERYQGFTTIFAYDMGDGSLKDHVHDVFGMYRELRPFFDVEMKDVAQKHPDLDVEHLMGTIIAVHDLGKPYAVEARHRERQHEYTVPMITGLLQRMGYNSTQQCVALNVVRHDLVGEALKEQRSRFNGDKSSAALLVGLAKECGIDIKSFWTLQKLFYMSDALAYLGVRPYFRGIRLQNGGLWPIHDRGRLASLEEEGLKKWAGIDLQIPAKLPLTGERSAVIEPPPRVEPKPQPIAPPPPPKAEPKPYEPPSQVAVPKSQTPKTVAEPYWVEVFFRSSQGLERFIGDFRWSPNTTGIECFFVSSLQSGLLCSCYRDLDSCSDWFARLSKYGAESSLGEPPRADEFPRPLTR